FLKIDLATSPEARSALGFSARETFSTMVSRLNTHQAGRSLFAGAATDRAAVMPADDMIADLKTALSGAVTASDVEARLDSWFHDAGGGFDTSGYTGADTHVQPTRLSDTESVTLTVRADDDVFRHLLKHTAMGMLATDPDLGFSDEVQAAVLSNAGQGIVNGQTGLTSLRADVGVVQERISDVQGRNDAQKTVLRVARNAIAAADPYETAIRLEQVQAQLEALYTVTARNRQLSLVNYLR
ncbi:MAG: flagellin, partial [Paracoccaceae bacterium]